ncbi:hypothetical protein PENTCL1PPCAC_16586, partial [Pristionchus entomophagus]
MQFVSPRYLLPTFIIVPPSAYHYPTQKVMDCGQGKNGVPIVVQHSEIKIDIEDTQQKNQDKFQSKSDARTIDDDCKIDRLFFRICYFCLMLGVNFYRNRCAWKCVLSIIIVTVASTLNVYFIGYVAYLCLSQKFEAERVATSISVGTWVLQATLSTLFLAFWQSTGQSCKLLRLLYEANKGEGVHHHRKSLVAIVRIFYVVLALTVCYYVVLIVANQVEYRVGYMDNEIPMIFGDRRLFIIAQLSILYCILCWGVALFIFSLLIHATHYEFDYFNQQVRSITCNYEYQTDETLCDYLIKLMKVHNNLTECVKRLDQMFNRYVFVMITTIIPTSMFSLFNIVHKPDRPFSIPLFISFLLVIYCGFSFYTLVNAPSKLHNTIYNTKSALCANTHVWFPYRPNVYHSALAFVCHLDQTNLGVSIWGFAVVSKPLVLTTLSVMVTCLALFLQVGDCNVENR